MYKKKHDNVEKSIAVESTAPATDESFTTYSSG